MAIHGPLTNATIYFSGYDFSGVTNEVKVDRTRVALKKTTFGSGGANEYVGGLFDTMVNVNGFTEYGSLLANDQLVASFEANAQTHSLLITPSGTDGGHASFVSAQLMNHNAVDGHVGELAAFTSQFGGRDAYGAVDGALLLPKQVLASGATNGTFNQLGAVTSSQFVFAALQVFAVTGSSPTLDVVVKSAATSGGSYTTRATFAQQTAQGDVFLVPVAGPFTDTFWKVTATVGGSSTPTVSAAVAVGIR